MDYERIDEICKKIRNECRQFIEDATEIVKDFNILSFYSLEEEIKNRMNGRIELTEAPLIDLINAKKKISEIREKSEKKLAELKREIETIVN